MLSRLVKGGRMVSTNQLLMSQTRAFAAQGVLTEELKEHLQRLGITNKNIVQNPT